MKLVTVIGLLFAVTLTSPSQADDPNAGRPQVALETSKGRIVVQLHADKAPKTVENFLEYVRSGHYDGTLFHRVIPGFMIQTGGYTSNLQQKPTRPPVENESNNGLTNDRGTLGMARWDDPHSATAQFFINLNDNPHLNHPGQGRGWGYTVFGRVVEGLEVVDAIAALPTSRRSVFEALPNEPVVIEKAMVLTDAARSSPGGPSVPRSPRR